MESQRSTKRQGLSVLDAGVSTVLDYNTFRWFERSLLYKGQVAKHVAKWMSRRQVHMKAQIFDPMDSISIILVLKCIQDSV